MRILSVNVAQPKIVVAPAGQPYSTAIYKQPVEGLVELTVAGFVGDRQADREHHGGPDKAVCCYPAEHLRHWEPVLGKSLPPASFGENLTVEGMLETDVCIGDTFHVGSATVQVSQPRQPCHKLANRHAAAKLPSWMYDTGFTGLYLRVLQLGHVQADDAIELVSRPHPGATVAWAMRAYRDRTSDEGQRRRLVALPALSAAWREAILRQLGDE